MRLRHAGLTAAVTCLLGCSSVYSVPGLEASAGVTLVNDSGSHLWITNLDGQTQGVPAHGRYLLRPGRHVIRVQYFWRRSNVAWNGNEMVDLVCEAAAGDTLKLVCQHSEEPGPYAYGNTYKGTWTCSIEGAGVDAPSATEHAATGELERPLIFPWM